MTTAGTTMVAARSTLSSATTCSYEARTPRPRVPVGPDPRRCSRVPDDLGGRMSIKKNPWFVVALLSVAVPVLIVVAKVAEYKSLKTATRRRLVDLERAERDAGCSW